MKKRKPETPRPKTAPDKILDASGRCMNAEELAECRAEIAAGLWGDQTPTPTLQHCVDMFEHHAERLREIVHQFAYSPDARSLAAHFDTWHSAVGFACDFTRKYVKNCPALPEVPDLSGNDYYAGIIRLADCCKSTADALKGKAGSKHKPTRAEVETALQDRLTRDKWLPGCRALAKEYDVAGTTIRKTTAWRTWMRQKGRKSGSGGRPVVKSLTPKLQASIGRQDAALERLTAEQEMDDPAAGQPDTSRPDRIRHRRP